MVFEQRRFLTAKNDFKKKSLTLSVMPHKITFMSAQMNLSSKAEVLAAIQNSNSQNRVTIATANPEFILETAHNPAFQKSLAEKTHTIIDGSGLFFGLSLWSRLKRLPKPELYHGSDLVADLFAQ